jgi:hypothetical protein
MMAFTLDEASRAVELLRPHFPVAEVRKIGNLPDAYFVRTYGEPLDLNTPADVARFIVSKITNMATL